MVVFVVLLKEVRMVGAVACCISQETESSWLHVTLQSMPPTVTLMFGLLNPCPVIVKFPPPLVKPTWELMLKMEGTAKAL